MTAFAYPRITVMMPVRNEQRHLRKSLESVIAQQYPGEMEILLAVGPSIDDTEKIAQQLASEYDFVRVIPNPKGLTTSGLNLAINEAKGDVVVRIDAHSEPAPGYLVRGVEILLSEKASLVGGIMNARGESAFQTAVAFGYRSRLGLGGGKYHIGGKAGEAESAYLGIFDAKVLKQVSGYDERIIRGEDWDLAQRIKAVGGKVWFSPDLVVDYWPRSNLKALAWQFYSTGVWRGDLTKKRFFASSIRYLIPPLALLSLIVLAVLWAVGVIASIFLIVPLAAYLLLLLFAAATAKELKVFDRLAILVALPVMHFSWATGFWVGLIFGAGKVVDSGDRK